jgi:8-oxo-dGTP pyrophosphatase MutT (NUDIX family)
MSIGAEEIRTVLDTYLAEYPDEADRLSRFTAALVHGSTLTSPAEARGHITSAVVLIDPRWRVLHIHYPSWSRWLLPGGHLTAGDDSLPGAALREMYELAGIEPDSVTPLPGFEATPIDIDTHRIPPDRTKGRPEHWHFEIRHAYQISGSPTIRLDPDDPGQPSWLAPDAIPGFPLRLKLRALHRALVTI